MTDKRKILGLALVAATAISGFAASASMAGTLHVGANPAVITGHSDPKEGGGLQPHLLSLDGGISVSCATVTVEGTVQQTGVQTQTIQEGTITPTYQQCTVMGQLATVQMNGCKYTITGAGQAANTALVDIAGCTAGKQITIAVMGCTVSIPEQNGLSHVGRQKLWPGGQYTSHTRSDNRQCQNDAVGRPLPGTG
jgi:hypothetical protein